MFRILAFALLATPALAAPWSYTDGAGKSVTLPEPPQRILAHINAAAGLMPFGIRPTGVFLDGAPSRDRAAEGLDLTGIEIAGRGWYELDAERVLALDPDLIVTEWWPREGFYGGAVGDAGIVDQIEAIAPIVGPAQGQSILTIIDDFAALAASLGADLQSPEIAQDRRRFDAALTRLKATIASKPGLTVMAASVSANGLSVAAPAEFAELSDFAAWGLNLVIPTTDPASSYHTLSWENVDTYAADLILLDNRWDAEAGALLRDNPLAARLPAVTAGQLGEWPAGWIRSYRVYAEELDRLATLIEAADPDIVPD